MSWGGEWFGGIIMYFPWDHTRREELEHYRRFSHDLAHCPHCGAEHNEDADDRGVPGPYNCECGLRFICWRDGRFREAAV